MPRPFRRILPVLLGPMLVIPVIGAPAVLGAQQAATRVFRLENVPPGSLGEILQVFEADIVANDELRILSVSAPPTTLEAIAAVVAELDVPGRRRSAELTVHILSGKERGSNFMSGVPGEVEPVVEELRNTFGYGSYQLVDTIVIRGLDGRSSENSGTIDVPISGAAPFPIIYSITGEFQVEGAGAGPPALHIDDMNFTIQMPVASGHETGFQFIPVGMNTSVEIPAGEQVVVGKSTVGETALILVMSAAFPD